MSRRPCIFGEVLFDHFADRRVLGGAPFNVAWHLQAFGQSPLFVSRVGKDTEGDEILKSMRDWGMDSSALQRDPARPTGKVIVRVENDEPAYDIVANCAYDAIDEDAVAASAAIRDCGFLYHGSLALRGQISRRSLQRLQAAGSRTVFVDVNLRDPWWRPGDVLDFLDRADWVKLNRDELELLGLDSSGEPLEPAAFLQAHGLRGLVLTLGASGARLYTPDASPLHVEPGEIAEFVDTVGAGDAFASVIILGLLREWPLQLSLQRAQDFAAKIVGQRGATTTDRSFYQPFIDNWKL